MCSTLKKEEALMHSETAHDSPLDISTWSRLNLDQWWLEIAGATLSLLSMMSIIIVLVVYDSKAAPTLLYGITLNAIISFLATITRASLLIGITAVISQDASRGPLGSLNLLALRRGSAVVWICAFATLSSLAFEPFIQQLMSFPLENIPSNSLFAAFNISWPQDHPNQFYETPLIDQYQYDQAVQSAIYDAAARPMWHPGCPRESCSWPPFYTLAVCSSCIDVTDQVRVTSEKNFTDMKSFIEHANETLRPYTMDTIYAINNQTYNLPSRDSLPVTVPLRISANTGDPGVALSFTYPRTLLWSLNFPDVLACLYPGEGCDDPDAVDLAWGNYAGLEGPIVAMGYLTLGLAEDGSHTIVEQAFECGVVTCAQERRLSVNGTTLSSEILSTTFGRFEAPPFSITTWDVKANGTKVSFYDDSGFSESIATSVYFAYLGNITTYANIYCGNSPDDTGGANNCSLVRNDDSDIYTTQQLQFIDHERNISNSLHDTASALSDLLLRNGRTPVKGQVLVPINVVRIRWYWITLPLAVVSMGVVSLLVTVYETYRSRTVVWKSSLFPLLYQGPFSSRDHGSGDKRLQLGLVSHLQSHASEVRFKLDRLSGGEYWRLEEEDTGKSHQEK